MSDNELIIDYFNTLIPTFVFVDFSSSSFRFVIGTRCCKVTKEIFRRSQTLEAEEQ